MGSEGIGNCSYRNRVNDNTDEQPFKKARYIWEVKGKYHLKNNERLSDNEDVNESVNDRTECIDQFYLKKLLAHSNNLMAYDDSSDDESQKNIDRSIHDEIPVTLVAKNCINQDYYLLKWQARQMAMGYMDNTINNVLESCMLAPVDASEFVEDCENDGQVEDEGILMAIRSHGLHSNDNNWNKKCEHSQISNSSMVKSQDIEEFALDNDQNFHNELYKNRMMEESNFLEAAVSVAIEKKGLSTQN